jgi:hypothetical protein
MREIPVYSQILGAIITPAVLISAAGTLALSTSNRLSRIVDRVRELAKEAARFRTSPGDESARLRATESERNLILEQLPRLSQRALLLRSAMTALYTAIGLLAATSIGIGIVALLPERYGWATVASGLAGVAALLYGSLLLVREARLAVRSTLQEMAFVRAAVLETGRQPMEVRPGDR